MELEHAACLAMITGVIELMRLEMDDREVEFRLATDDLLAWRMAEPEASALPADIHRAFHSALHEVSRVAGAIGVLVELADSFTPKATPAPVEDEAIVILELHKEAFLHA